VQGRGSIGRLRHECEFFLSQELLNCHRCVTGRIVMVQDPAILPFLRPPSPHILTRTCQNLNVVSSSNASPLGTNSWCTMHHLNTSVRFRELFECTSYVVRGAGAFITRSAENERIKERSCRPSVCITQHISIQDCTVATNTESRWEN
jgi:hypothetical protein